MSAHLPNRFVVYFGVPGEFSRNPLVMSAMIGSEALANRAKEIVRHGQGILSEERKEMMESFVGRVFALLNLLRKTVNLDIEKVAAENLAHLAEQK